MSRLKELFSDTVIYGISTVAARFLNYLLVPFYTDVFDPAVYGVIGLIYAAIIFFNVLFQFGMESAYLKYASDRDKAQDVFKTLELTIIGGATVLALVTLGFQDILVPLMEIPPDLHYLIWMMLIILWLDATVAIPFAELRLKRHAWMFSFVKLGGVVINLVMNFVLVLGFGWGIEAVLVSNVIGSVFTWIGAGLATRGMWSGVFNREVMNKALHFGLPYVPAGLGYAINEVLDRFFLAQMPQETVNELYGTAYSAASITGIYNACYKLAVFMMLFIQMYRMAWQPFFLNNAKGNDERDVYAKAFLVFNAVAAVAFMFVALFKDWIVAIEIPLLNAQLIDERYWLGLHVVPLLLLAYWFQGWYVNFTAGIFIEEQTKKLPKITLTGAVVTIVLNVVLIPLLGMMGAAIATVTSYLVMAIFIYSESMKVYPIKYPWASVLFIMGMALTFVFGYDVINSYVQIEFIRTVLFIIGFIVCAMIVKRNLHKISL